VRSPRSFVVLAAVIAAATAAAVVGTVVAPADAGAATRVTDTIRGAEVAFTATQGTFVGVATGDLPGGWRAVIDHTRLSPGATITGGTFVLRPLAGLGLDAVRGRFAWGGRVTRVFQAPGCGRQVYAVRARLRNVGVGGGTGTGAIAARLTHYRTLFLGRCVAYRATVNGTVTLTY
jgi:hypothetical protein